MKRYLAECIGTFFLALAVNFTGDALAIGLMFMAMVYIFGPISGCHLNPAISLSMFVHRRISLATMAFYMVAQVIGACLFFALAFFIFGSVIPARIIPAEAFNGAASFELLLTMVLCSVILVVTSCNKFKDSHVNGLVIGLTFTALATFPGLYNPALALGSMISNFIGGQGAMPGLKEAGVYLILPLLAGAAAALKYNYFYSEHPDNHGAHQQ
ncbi:MAG: aquaporin [Candidatus Babeliales bacterium]|nr:aquaporin [Candidatus Babeliales bacterium]